MGLHYEDLDDEVRAYMLEEIQMDVDAEKIYLSPYLTQRAQGDWPDHLKDAARSGSDTTLAAKLRITAALNERTTQQRNGKTFPKKVPHNAPEVLSESEFNRYYARALARKAIADGIERLEVYRAKAVAQPRPESEQKIGLLVQPDILLLDVRSSNGVETALGIPPGPGSGISVRIPRSMKVAAE